MSQLKQSSSASPGEQPHNDGQDADSAGEQTPEAFEESENHFTSKTKSWRTICNRLKTYDEAKISRWQDEMDTVLILSGLLSGVLTAFLSETYQLLQQNSTNATNDILARISIQLANPGVSSASVNHPDPLFSTAQSASFHPPAYAVRVNLAWFLSLVLSLVVALVGILVKQWLREYMSFTLLPSTESTARMRQHRYDGLYNWNVPQIVGILPTLLQAAVFIFLLGLLDFLHALHTTIFAVIAAVTLAPLFLVLLSTVLPLFSYRCPYKSPLAWFFVRCVALMRYHWTKWRLQQWLSNLDGSRPPFLVSLLPRWFHAKGVRVGQLRELELASKSWIGRDTSLGLSAGLNGWVFYPGNVRVLGWAYQTFSQEPEVVIPVFNCVRDIPEDDVERESFLSVLAYSVGFDTTRKLLQNTRHLTADLPGRLWARLLPRTTDLKEFNFVLDFVDSWYQRKGIADDDTNDVQSVFRLLKSMTSACKNRDAEVDGRYARLCISRADKNVGGVSGAEALRVLCCDNSNPLKLSFDDMLYVVDWAIASCETAPNIPFITSSSTALNVTAQYRVRLQHTDEALRQRLDRLLQLMTAYLHDHTIQVDEQPVVETGWLQPLAVLLRYDHTINIDEFKQAFESAVRSGSSSWLPNQEYYSRLMRNLPEEDQEKTGAELLNLSLPSDTEKPGRRPDSKEARRPEYERKHHHKATIV